MDCPTECKVLNNTVKTEFELKKCENLCGSEKTETNNVAEYDQIFDLNHENPSYFNSSINDCDVSIYEYFDCNDKTVQEEDSEDIEKTIQNQFLITDDQHTNSLNNLTEFRDSLNIDSVHEKICRVRYVKEEFIDSGISTNELIAENFINSQNIPERNDVTCKIIEEDTKNKEMKFAQNVTCINIEDSLQEELDIQNSVSAIKSDNYFISNNENYFKNDIDLSKCMEENANHMLSICTEKDSIEETIIEIKKMDKIIKNLLYTSDDEHYDSTEERMIEDLSAAEERIIEDLSATEEQMIEDLSAKMEDDCDDVMKKIIESCCHAADFQQCSTICEISNADSIQSSSKRVIKEFRENEFFSCHRVVSETIIAKEDILKTIEEAEKILTDSPYWEKSEAIVNQITENSNDKNNSSEKSAEKVRNDKEHERINETISQKEIDLIEIKDNKINSTNTIEKIAVSKSDVVEHNLQKLAEITCSDRLRSRIEIRETLEKIAEEKKKIENRKNVSLETLSKKFEEIDKLVVDHNYTFFGSDNDSYELKTPENVANDFDSLSEFQVQIDPEVPLTKPEIAEKLKIEELEKELEDEIKEHKKLMDEYQKIIVTDLEKIQLTLESKSMQVYNGTDIDKEIKNKSKDDEKISEEFSNEILEMIDDTMVIKIDSESDDFFMEEWKEPERTYIKGKVYDFDEKKHGIR